MAATRTRRATAAPAGRRRARLGVPRSAVSLLGLCFALLSILDTIAAAQAPFDSASGRRRAQVPLGVTSEGLKEQEGSRRGRAACRLFDSMHREAGNSTSDGYLESLRAGTASAVSPLHADFHRYEDIVNVLRSFAIAFPRTEVFSVGRTAEGRDIWAIRVYPPERPNGACDEGSLREFVIAGGQHAREWISTSTVLYLLHQRLLDPPSPDGDDAEVARLTFTYVPVVNPDGYEYTWTTDRLWRKNRQEPDLPPTATDGCVGLDLNRNWGYHFLPPRNTPRPNPCSDSFPGMRAFEALETAALARYLLGVGPEAAGPTTLTLPRRVFAFLDLHAYGQQLLFPYAYTCARQPPEVEDLWEAGYGAAKALRMVHGRHYEVGGRCDVSYAAPGDAIDWTYGAAGIKWSFAAELRGQQPISFLSLYETADEPPDFGTFGFLLPPSQIVPQGEEAYAMLQSLAAFVAEKEKGRRA